LGSVNVILLHVGTSNFYIFSELRLHVEIPFHFGYIPTKYSRERDLAKNII